MTIDAESDNPTPKTLSSMTEHGALSTSTLIEDTSETVGVRSTGGKNKVLLFQPICGTSIILKRYPVKYVSVVHIPQSNILRPFFCSGKFVNSPSPVVNGPPYIIDTAVLLGTNC